MKAMVYIKLATRSGEMRYNEDQIQEMDSRHQDHRTAYMVQLNRLNNIPGNLKVKGFFLLL